MSLTQFGSCALRCTALLFLAYFESATDGSRLRYCCNALLYRHLVFIDRAHHFMTVCAGTICRCRQQNTGLRRES